MSIRRARPLDALYEAVADHDLVIVPDNALADAINRRVETPQFGTFATTPRRIATGRREQAEDRLAFLEVIDQTDHSWKAIAYAIGNVLQCWEHRGTHDAVLDYDAYTDDTTEQVVGIMAGLQSTSNQLTDYTIDNEQSVAVVGYKQLTELERSILPVNYDRVGLFTDDPFDHPPFHVFDSSADIIDSLLDTVTAENSEEIAVVLDSGSRYSSLVESALDAADIPYYGGSGFVDDPDHRAFVCLLRSAYRGSDTTVADVKSVCSQMGIGVDIEHDEKRLRAVEIPKIEWIREFCGDIDSRTFSEAVNDYESKTGRSLDDFRNELSELDLADQSVDRRRVEDLVYYLQTYEVPVDRENEGVLLADAKSSGYVDRPVVFYLGIDEGWTHSAPQRPWVDTEAQFERYIRRFQLLLQSGAEQYYLVQDTAGGQPVTPCLYLGELLDADFERFSDLDSVRYTRPPDDGAGGFEKEPVNVDPEAIDTVSQSSLNTYVNSPRDYFFSRLLDSPDKDYFREGNLFHDFAEFYVNHPDRIDDVAIDEVVDVMLDEAGAFFHEDDEPLRRRKYRIGLETIVEFLDANRPERDDFLTPSSGWGTNFFEDHFGEPIDSPLTERWFENEAIGAKGKIDLIRAADHLVDYKSGRRKSAYSVVTGAAVDPPDDTPNFQAALYLSHFRTEQPGTRIEFTFFHFLETLDGVVAGEADLDDTLTTVTYYPETFAAFVASREAYGILLDGYNDCVATFEDLGFEAYENIVTNLSFPETTDRDELRESAFARKFTDAVDAATGGDVDAEKGCDQAIRELNGVRKRAFFRENLDSFEGFLADRIEEINHYRAGEDRFPVDGPAGEPNYRRVDHRDLLLEGER
ncbi:PD-(D/E)XK nuclease family protein [Halobellus captivus]|uniref:PD-(D/E)XK nuclease family protein n=1 Tax=Halobellus captivus TaxID=2592614 RepID=UPI0011AA55E8|nr:PD-(D/E)XK nuclease family protein [Halobellus captivus]